MAAPKIHIVRDEPSQPAREVERYQHGWRTGKPVEDPEKLKRWGYVGAKPSEYLVCTKRGEIDRKRSGQGLRIFKWPWHAVAIVPTTLQRIEFVADQVTRERVGVEITGIAVYRIAEPELAFRVLNFTYGEAASEKLAATLREMFVGAARRLVANLGLEECLTRRKETIAQFLMEEIAPVVSGRGSPDDTTTCGWGVVIDTIEIQQVTIQSSQVFAHLQAPYRHEIAARAELADLERVRQVAEVRATAARRNAELERDKKLHEIAIAEEETRARAAAAVVALEAERTRVEAAHRAAELAVANDQTLQQKRQDGVHALAIAEVDAELARRKLQAEAELELRRNEADMREAESQFEALAQRRLAEIELMLTQSRTLRELVVTALPQIAHAMHRQVETLHLTQIGNGDAAAGPLAAVPAAIGQLLALAQSFGLELKKPGSL
jgi:flotillin